MTITTQTAPISTDQKNAIKAELAEHIAASTVRIPEAFGCDQAMLAAIESSLEAPARELLRQVPSDDRRSVLALAVMQAVKLRNK